MSLDMAVHSHGIQCSNKKRKKKSNTIHYINCFCFYLLFFLPQYLEVLLICNTSISNTILREYNSSNKLIV